MDKLERHFSSNDKFLKTPGSSVQNLGSAFPPKHVRKHIPELPCLGLYSLRSHDKQKTLNLRYEWFLIIDREAERDN